jgi:hypothetical protein
MKTVERERTAERFHHDHGLDRPAVDAAMLLGEGERGQAELGVLPPHVAAPAVGLLHVFLACLEFIALRAQPLDAVFQQALFVGKFEVHFSTSTQLCPGRNAARSGALQTRDRGQETWTPDLRCIAHALHRVRGTQLQP